MELNTIFGLLANRITVQGTTGARDELDALSGSVRALQPGAAAALVDWEGSEIARERAFAVIRHAAVRADASVQRRIATALRAARGVALVA